MTSNTGFFRAQEAPAVLKHGILKRYPVVFASAAGGKAERVVLLDGYAGRGQYEDGKPGSPLLLIGAATKTESFRNVECVFVERDKANFDVLSSVVAEHGGGRSCAALQGALSDHLDSILTGATGAALFAFLDPFGTGLDYSELTQRILGRPKLPPTEVLLHFSVNAVRRIGGLLRARATALTEPDRKTIERVDRFLGGDWWHQTVLDANDEPGVATKVAEEVADAYCRKVGGDTGSGTFWFPVRDRPGLAPDYLLVLFARHPYAMWRFNDSLSKANVEWQEAWRGKANAQADAKARQIREAEAARGVMSLFGDDGVDVAQPFPAHEAFDEKAEAQRWIATIEANLTAMLRKGASFRLMEHTGAVYGDVLGEAREMHVAKALKNLYAAGISADNGVGKDLHRRLVHPGPNARQS